MVKGYVPAKGDIVWIEHEQKWHRPAIVVFEVSMNHDGINGVVLSDQVKSLDWKVRNASFIAKADEKELEAVLRNISVILLGD